MGQRLRVLISAYACEPHKGSEPDVGWQWALQMARFHEVTVLTRANNRPVIEAEIEALQGRQPLPRFVYHDRQAFLLELKRRTQAIQLYYLLWQKSARDLIARLHEVYQYDLLHHVTFAGFRYPVAVWGHGVPCIWGPVGGIESIPWPLLPWRHPASLVREGLRNLSNTIQATPMHVLPGRGLATTLLLASTAEMQRAFGKLGLESRLMGSVGLRPAEMPYRPHAARAGPLKVLFVGNIITLKGVDLALEAFAASGVDATFTLIGAGNYLPVARRKAAALGLGERVVFKGRWPRPEVLQAYPDYDLFLFPSLHDTGGYAVLEAMFNELPVICLDCGGPALAVKPECGRKVAVGRRAEIIAGLAEAIRWYAGNPGALAAQGQAARQVVLREYDWDRKGEQMNACYAEAVAIYRGKQKTPALARGDHRMGRLANLLHRVLSLKGLAVSLLSLVLVGLMGFLSVSHVKRQARAIAEETLPGLTDAGEAAASQAQGVQGVLLLVMSDDPQRRQQLRAEIARATQATTAHLATYKASIFQPEDRSLYAAVLKERRDYLRVREDVISLAESNRRPEAIAACVEKLLPAYQRYRAATDQLFEYNVQEAKARGHTIMTICTVTQWAVAGIAIIVFILGFLIGLAR
jgi:glycosyltransferase involved in cell wall biosynthesis